MRERNLRTLAIALSMSAAISLAGCGGGGGSRSSGPATPPDVLPLPAGHGVSAGVYILEPGESQELGNVVLTCPAGGSTCSVTVSADGSARYSQRGDAPLVMAVQVAWSLPLGHGVSAREITVRPGQSQAHGNVVLTCPVGGSACVVTVASDGSATYERTGGVPAVMPAQASWTLPTGHGVSAGVFTLRPGESAEHGNVVFICPAGGGIACVVTVAADGTASYHRTGGRPLVMAAVAPWMLPAGHGVSPGVFTVQPGRSQTRGNVEFTCPVGGSACVVTVAADGTATYHRTGGVPVVLSAQLFLELPAGHGVSAGEFTVQPDESRELGNVLVTCPADGSACVVTVAADGTATYERTGGVPAVTAAPAPWMLPASHGVSAGEITLQPGESQEHGNVVLTCPVGGSACVVTFAADGTVSYARTGGMPNYMLVSPEEVPELGPQQPRHATLLPVVDLGDMRHVGADVAPPAAELAAGDDYNGVAVSSGTVRDGVGATRVLEFLKEHVSPGKDKINPGLEGYSTPPVVRLAEGTDEALAELVVRAVRLVNAALPQDRRIVLSTNPAPALANLADVPDGQIFVDFAPWADWATSSKPPAGDAAAIAERDIELEFDAGRGRWEAQGTRASHIWVDTDVILQAWVLDAATGQWEEMVLASHADDTDTTVMHHSEDANTAIVVHELLHTLGFAAHVDPARFMNASIVNDEDTRDRIVERSGSYGSVTFTLEEHNFVPGHLLHPLDREALLAALDRFEPGALPEDLSAQSLGPWDDTSFHLLGVTSYTGGEASFGVATRNGLAQPWATGPAPWTELTDSQSLAGSVTWNGALLGVTAAEETVAGNASLTIDLTDLGGQLDFTNLEQWGVNDAPGAAGTGTMWGDGDLGYTIEVQGNTFVRTGGDDGEITGAFFGAAHEAMGGALERGDLTAGFGGTR